jgi:pentatricopeptide repeat protein
MSALFALAEKFNFKPDVITYTTLVQGLLRAGEMEMAKKALGAMAAQGIEPNERMCSMLIADLAKSGLRSGLTNAEDMLADMRRRKMKVGVVTWTGLISGYFRGGWEDDGWAAVRRMETQGLRLNRVAYNVILRQAGESPRAGSASGPKESLPVKLFKRMIDEGVQPSSDTFVILLTPMVRGKRWNETDWVIKKMEKVGFVPEKAALRTLLRKIRLRRSL